MLSFKPTFSLSTFTFIKRLFSSSSLTFFEILISLFLLIPLVSQFSEWLSRIWLFVTYGLKHDRLPCPSPAPRACSNSCPLSLWCHPAISSSVIPFSSCLQSFPALGSFPMSHLFASGGQSIRKDKKVSRNCSCPGMLFLMGPQGCPLLSQDTWAGVDRGQLLETVPWSKSHPGPLPPFQLCLHPLPTPS